MRANILKIQRYAVNDGPGIRTTVFLKGCPLRCKWCHNPEAMRTEPQLMVNDSLCIRCGACAAVCPNGVHTVTAESHSVDFGACATCGSCVEACPSEALTIQGSSLSIEEIMDTVRRDAGYYRESGGGVTVSGGEPLMAPEFLDEFITACHQESIPVYLDTCGHADPEVFRRIASKADGVLFDLKVMDEQEHRAATGAGNERILQNFRTLCEVNSNVRVRAVVVPGINDSLENHARMAAFLDECGFSGEIDLLAYHDYGKNKYAHLGYAYQLPATRPPTDEKMRELAAFLSARGFNVKIK